MLFETNKDKGRAGMAMGIAYFGANGYTVNMPLNDTQCMILWLKKMVYFRQFNAKQLVVKIIQFL